MEGYVLYVMMRDYMFRGEFFQRLGWIYVLFAAIVEIFWVIGLKYSETIFEWLGTTVAIIFSFYFIIKACEQLPAGTVYAVFTGSGAAAIAIIDFTIFKADFALAKVLFIVLIILGVVGLKMTTDEKTEKQVSQGQGGE